MEKNFGWMVELTCAWVDEGLEFNYEDKFKNAVSFDIESSNKIKRIISG